MFPAHSLIGMRIVSQRQAISLLETYQLSPNIKELNFLEVENSIVITGPQLMMLRDKL